VLTDEQKRRVSSHSMHACKRTGHHVGHLRDYIGARYLISLTRVPRKQFNRIPGAPEGRMPESSSRAMGRSAVDRNA